MIKRPTSIKFQQTTYPHFKPREWTASYDRIWVEDRTLIFPKLRENFPNASIWADPGRICITFWSNEDNDYFKVLNSENGVNF